MIFRVLLSKVSSFTPTKPYKVGSIDIFPFYWRFKKCKFLTYLKLGTAETRTSSFNSGSVLTVLIIKEDTSSLGLLWMRPKALKIFLSYF